MNLTYIILIPLIPLLVFLLLGIFNQKIKPAVSGYIGVAGLSVSTMLSFYTAYKYFFQIRKSEWRISSLVCKNNLDELYRNTHHRYGYFNRSYIRNDAYCGINRILNGAYLQSRLYEGR